MRKTVVLCEGVHDLTLLSLILERAGVKFQRKSWEDILSASSQSPENTTISLFLGRKGRGFSFLLKQDCDVDTCIQSFWTLYSSGNPDYDLKMVVDSDGYSSIRKIRNYMVEILKKDVLLNDDNQKSVLCWKSGEHRPAVFLYPCIDFRASGKLTDIVQGAGCGNLAGCRDDTKRQEMLSAYLDLNHKWIDELQRFLLD